MIHFRKNHPILRQDTFFGDKQIKWHGAEPEKPDWKADDRLVIFTLLENEKHALYIAFNALGNEQKLKLPPLEKGKSWYWVVNTFNTSPNDFFDEKEQKKVNAGEITIGPYSSIILKAK
jgi:pullulanase/glycogen debranching enzyme